MARHCLEPRCSEVVEGRVSYCDVHAPPTPQWAGSKSNAKGWRWVKLRRRVLERDKWRCQSCEAPAKEVDHIINAASLPPDDPRLWDMANLVSLCRECHRDKSEVERIAGLRLAAARRRGSR